MEFKGTKGKWYHCKGTVSIWHPTSTGIRIASVDCGWTPTKEDYANATLIAHAPEMLSLLKHLYNDVEMFREIESHGYGNELTDLIKRATEI